MLRKPPISVERKKVSSCRSIDKMLKFLLNYLGGAAPMSKETVLCEIEMTSGKVYKVRSFIMNAKLIEFNSLLCSNPALLAAKP